MQKNVLLEQGIMRAAIRIANILVLCALICTASFAQSTAQISGAVKDQTGAVLPGVEVTVTQTDTGVARSAITDETGSYTLTTLPVGPYRFEASLPGFKTYVQTGIVLQVSANPVINVVLEIGQVSDQIEVNADAALVETRSTGVGQVIDNQRVLELPLNGRQANELILLSGVATLGFGSGVNRANSVYSTTSISVAGGLSTGLAYQLDGGAHNDPYNNFNLPLPFPDALQEFKVETSAVPAQYGRNASGAVNAVTKSGTNQFHGDLFEFVRNGSMNARNAFAIANDGLKRNQYGGTIGGPAVKNKLFFFGGYQGTKERSAATDRRQYVPTAAMLAGDFTAMASPACNNNRQINLPAQYGFAANRIDPALLNPVAVNIVKRLPATTDPCGLVFTTAKNKSDENLYVTKVDYQGSQKHSIFVRYLGAHKDTPTDFVPGNMLSLSQPNQLSTVHSLTVGDTYLFGTNTVSAFHATAFRTTNPKEPPPLFDEAEVGLKNVFNPFKKLITVGVAGAFALPGGTVQPGHYNGTGFEFNEDLSTVWGAHQIAFGADFLHRIFNGNSGNGVSPNFSFTTQYTGMAMADFLLGKVASFDQRSDVVLYPRMHYAATYLQDTWKVNSRLTLNMGVRWEPYLSTYSKNGQTTFFDRERFDTGIRSTVLKKAPVGLFFSGDPGTPGKSYSSNHWLHFAPRLGLAFDPNGDGRMTIRAAYGLFYDIPHLWYFYGPAAASPWGYSVNLTAPPSFEDVYSAYPGGNPFPLKVTPDTEFPAFGSYVVVPENMRTAYANQWNLSLQKQFGSDWLITANYLGNNMIHFRTLSQANPPKYIPGASCVINGITYSPCSSTSNVDQRRELYLQNPSEGRLYGGINLIDDGGTMTFHGLLLSAQHRSTKGVTIQGNYTLSHCIGDYFDGMPHPISRVPGYGPGNRDYNRGNCDSDRRQVVNVSTVIQTPKFSNRTLEMIASGWQLSGIVRLQTGGYFEVASGSDTSLTGRGQANRANQVLADVYAANKNVDHWLNPAAFVRPPTGEFGNASNSIQGPGTISINMGLTRTFNVRENQTIQFRAEAFNMPNHLNPSNPVATLSNANFGKIQTAGDPRIMQLALKYVF